jgi:hypothetical protein
MNPELKTLLDTPRWSPVGGEARESPRLLRLLGWFQGIFYVLTGVWPLVSIGTFQLVTGPKLDLWLVKTVGLLIAVIGLALLAGAKRRRIGPELVLLAAGSAASLAAVDIVYALSGRISDIYLLDAAVEIPLAVAWVVGWFLARGKEPIPGGRKAPAAM